MSTNTTDYGTPVHRDLWNACAGADVVAPFPSDHLNYIPKGHADHCSASSQVLSSLEYMPPIHCDVSQVLLRADPLTDEVYAKVTMKPCSVESRVIVPKPPKPMIDFSEKSWTFKLMFRDDHQDYLVTHYWASFVIDKSVHVGDVVVFLRDRILDNTRFSVRRASPVSVPKRNDLCLEAFSKVHGYLSSYYPATITCYPNGVDSNFLVPVPLFETILGMDWGRGVRVSKWNDNREHQGTITESNFKNPSSVDLSGSKWNCLCVQWDEPGCFSKQWFSPWELRQKKTNSGAMLFGIDLSVAQGITKKKRKRRQTQA
ncbi:auxin response factor 9-like [Capsella rubella]|uniref:auxin response factor 9-like n=1 Tax=Capsella rubella TaxID=81985 RepID=UPI000CD4BC7E|nr:auxin response factor 9-like [Capsella rubella]